MTHIALRLPDHLVAFLDERVAGGETSRAAVVIKALTMYERQLSAEIDGTTPDDPDMQAFAVWNANRPEPWLD